LDRVLAFLYHSASVMAYWLQAAKSFAFFDCFDVFAVSS